MLEIVKIYGERNTGTTVLRQVLKQNFHCKLLFGTGRIRTSDLILPTSDYPRDPHEQYIFQEALIDDAIQKYIHQDLGWKHACPPIDIIQQFNDLPKTLFIIISKDPYSWLLSLYKRPYHQRSSGTLSFSDFLRHYWLSSRKDNIPWSVIKNPICLYMLKLQAYQDLSQLNCHVLHIKYTDFLEHFEAIMETLSLYLKKKVKHWIMPLLSSKDNNIDFYDYQKKYQRQTIFSHLSAEDLDFINQNLDPELLTYWGYEIIEP